MDESVKENTNLSLSAFRDVLRYGARIMKIMWPENQFHIIALAVVFILLAIVPFFGFAAYGLLINAIIESTAAGAILTPLIIAFAFYAGSQLMASLMLPVQEYFMRVFISKLNKRMDILFLNSGAKADFAMREDPAKMGLFNNVHENWWRPREFVRRQYFMIQNVFEVGFASIIVFVLNPLIFLALLLGAIPELIVEAKYGQHIWGIYSAKADIRRRYWDIREYFHSKSHLFDMKLFQNINYFLGVLSDLIQRFMIEERKAEKRKLKKYIWVRGAGQIIVLGAYVWFIYDAVHGDLSVGTLVFVFGAIFNFRQSLSAFFQNLGMQFQDSLFIGDLLKVVDMKPIIAGPENPLTLSPSMTPEIVFDKVTFKYPNSSEPVLKNFSLTIRPGEKIALIGVNGAGKTTFVKLLLRFYDPTDGKILVNGQDLRTIDRESWYELIGVLFQDYANYHLLVKDVIASGRASKEPELENIKRSAYSAEADTFIEEWEKKYDQQLGSWLGGTEPSIGQWQKIGLARTFYRDPRILILDEPTSSIDAEAEAKIFEKLEALPSDRTVILISHRFSTVRKANQIVIIEDGAIKELGTHEELIKQNGIYARLFNLQAKGYQ